MKAEDQELGMLLTRERRHLIPTYQRDYEWTEAGQWQLLTDDILDVATRLLQSRSNSAATESSMDEADSRVGPHFLGAVVLEAVPQRGAHVIGTSVIDGQQRLTTVFLLLRGLLDLLTERGVAARAKQVRKWILIRADEVDDPDEMYKLWPRRRDRSAWRDAMSDDGPSIDHRYVDARLYFRDRFSAALEGLSDEDGTRFLNVLVDALATKIKIVVVDLEASDDAQLIFEVLNGRQTPLSATDLVKNLLFMRSGPTDGERDHLYDTYWAPFDDRWWSGVVGRGHAARGRRDQLLATWLTIKTSDQVNLGRLYGEARSYLNRSTDSLPSILEDIHHLAREYRSIYDHDDDDPPPIAAAYRRLERLGVTTAVPLLAWLRTLPPARLTPTQHERAVSAIDSYVMRRLITSGQTRAYGRVFLQVLQAAQAVPDAEPLDEAIIGELLAAPHGERWPSDDEIADEFESRTFYGRISQERIRMILGPIDAHMQVTARKAETALFDYDVLTIEHVMPREWKEFWPISADAPVERELAAQKRERHVHRLGNLTLITGALNSSVSNGDWEATKRPALAANSKLALNEMFRQPIPWNESSIEDRGRSLASIACAVWSRPPDPDRADADHTEQADGRADNRDWTRYHVIADGIDTPDLNKRGAVREMVTQLVSAGVSPRRVSDVLKPREMPWFTGSVADESDLRRVFAEQHPELDFDRYWPTTWFHDPGSGRTFALLRQWGLNTEPTLAHLVAAFPEADVTFRRATGAP